MSLVPKIVADADAEADAELKRMQDERKAQEDQAVATATAVEDGESLEPEAAQPPEPPAAQEPAPAPEEPAPAEPPAPKPDAEIEAKLLRLQEAHDLLAKQAVKQGNDNNWLRSQVGERDRRIADLERQLAARPEPKAEEDEELTEQEKELGPEVFNVARKVARKETAELRKQLDAFKAQVAPAADPAETFWRTFPALVPDWAQMNGDETRGLPPDPAFVTWLDGVDPGEKRTRRALIAEAQAQHDPYGVAKHFQAFRAQKAQAAATSPVAASRPSVAAQAATAPRPATPAKPGPKGRTYTLAEYERLMDDATTPGRLKPERARELEKTLDQALKEHRVEGS